MRLNVNWKKLVADSDRRMREYEALPDVLDKPGPHVFQRKAEWFEGQSVMVGCSSVPIGRLRILSDADREALKPIDAELHRLHVQRQALLDAAWNRARVATLEDVKH